MKKFFRLVSLGSVTGAGVSEPELFREQNFHRYIQKQKFSNSLAYRQCYGSRSCRSQSFFMNRVCIEMYELISSVTGAEPSEPELFHEKSCMNTICTNTRPFE
jgi:hypothetical protein